MKRKVLPGDLVFPAPAGVILDAADMTKEQVRFPRTCGGDPTETRPGGADMAFSPHLRG